MCTSFIKNYIQFQTFPATADSQQESRLYVAQLLRNAFSLCQAGLEDRAFMWLHILQLLFISVFSSIFIETVCRERLARETEKQYMIIPYIDVDECSRGLDNCGSNSQCINTNGSFLCRCYDGYTGNGVYCYGE